MSIHVHGNGPPMPIRPWRSSLLDYLQFLMVLGAIVAALVYFEIRVRRMHFGVVEQVDRIEAGVDKLNDFVDEVKADNAAKDEATAAQIEAVRAEAADRDTAADARYDRNHLGDDDPGTAERPKTP